jgi:8-amino-7-oxononanoate synthase
MEASRHHSGPGLAIAASLALMSRGQTVHLDHLPGSFFGPSNLVDLLRHRASHQGNEKAFGFLRDGETDEVSITYAELDRQARAIGAVLESRGMEGERALLLYPAGLDFIAAFFGCLYAQVVAVPAYPPRRNRKMSRIEAIVEDARARVALTTSDVLERIQETLDNEARLRKLTWITTDVLASGTEDDWHPPDVHGDTLAFLQYTSGSTGHPKGVMLAHSNLLHNSAMISYVCEHTRSGSGVFWLPSYHDMGLIGGILQPMYFGRPNILMSPMAFLQKPFRWLQAISHYRCTISGGPNFAYDLCVEKITREQRDTLDLSSWTVAFNGAEPIRPDTIDKFSEYFAPCGFCRETFFPCYGLAEATLLVSGGFKSSPPVVRWFDAEALEQNLVVDAIPDEPGARELVGSGGNLLDQRAIIVDPETETEAPPGRVGEIWVSGPSVAQGYWNNPQETEYTFYARLKDSPSGTFLRTGDLGFFQDGELFVTGRLKDLIIIRGRNHYPQDIEWTVETAHPRLRQDAGAAFSVEVEGRERLVIVHEVDRRGNGDLAEVTRAIRTRVAAEHDVAVEAVILLQTGSIPKTTSGKIQRHACRAAFLEDSLSSVTAWISWKSAAAQAPAAPTTGRVPGVAAFAPANGAVAPRITASPAVVRLEHPTTTDIVLQHVRKIGKERAAGLTLDASIVELGLDSLERMEIVASLEEHYGGRFPEHVLNAMETCREVIDAVDAFLVQGKAIPVVTRTREEITPDLYQIDKFPEVLKLRETSQAFAAVGIANPFFTVHQSVTNDRTIISGREYTNFSSYNYLGLSGDPRVSAAAKEAIDQYGTSVSASRLVSGEKTIHQDLEQAIADLLGTESAVVFVGGHATNESTIGHLLGPDDLIVHDALAHNSIVQGARLSGARRRPFPHNDWRALDEILSSQRNRHRRVLIAIEGVYSMDGDVADLPGFIDVKRRHRALLFVDEAHSLGVLGMHGRGISEHFGVNPRDVDLWMGTLSKALGSCGGYIAGNQTLVEYLKYTAPGFVFSVGMSPPNAGAALAAIRILEEEPDRVAALAERSRHFLQLARKRGLNTGLSHHTAIVPIILGSSRKCLLLSRALFEKGINVQPILYPAVEESATRLRFFLTSTHTEEQIRSAVESMAETLAEMDGEAPAAHRAQFATGDRLSARGGKA